MPSPKLAVCPVRQGSPEGDQQPVAFPLSAPGGSLFPVPTTPVVSGSEGKLVFENLIFWFQCYAVGEFVWLAGTPLTGRVLVLGQGVPKCHPPRPGSDACQCTLSGSEFTLAVTSCPRWLPCHKKQVHPHRKQHTRRESGSSTPVSPVWIKHLL